MLHDHQQVIPPTVLLAPVVADSAGPAFFSDRLRQAQEADPQLVEIKAQLLDTQGPPPVFRMLYSVVDDLVVVAETDGRQRIVVPDGALRADICKYFHDENGHPGVHRTIHAISSYFFWPNMHRDIRAFVVSCQACQAAKAKTRLPGGFSEPLPVPATPGSHWILDFIDLPESANGFSKMLVFSDQLSKLVVLVPMKSTSATDVAKAFVDHVFSWFGAPQSLVADNGPPFASAVFHEIFRMLGSTVRHSSPHTPQSHGGIERQNRIYNDLVKVLNYSQFPDMLAKWDEHAKLLQFFLNSAVVGRHGMSPLFFFFGRQPRIPATITLPDDALDARSLEFVQSFQSRVQEAIDAARLGQLRMIAAMDKGRDFHNSLAVGDFAYLSSEITPTPGEKHFKCKWDGPFPVKAVSASTATLELPEHWQLSSNTFHLDTIKKYIPRDGAPLPPQRPRRFCNRSPPSLGTIARISHHGRTGRVQADGRRQILRYFVHWEGLPPAYGEWLTEAQLQVFPNAQTHIQNYLRQFNVTNP